MNIELQNKRNNRIDALRGIAILSVILLHINIRIPFKETFIGSTMPRIFYNTLFWSGYYGVCIFFVISGFLITTSTLNKWGSLPNISLRGFYSFRFARIMPLLIALIAVLTLLDLIGAKDFVINPAKTSLGNTIFAAITFRINMLEVKVGYLPGSWDVLWSLSIEEMFYLFFPIVCFFLRKNMNFIVVAAVFLIVSPLVRTLWLSESEFSDRNYFDYTDALSLGCVAAILTKKNINKLLLSILWIVGWGLFLSVIVFRTMIYKIGLTAVGIDISLLAVGTACILIWMQKRFMDGRDTSSRFTAMLCFFGRNSYEVYLTHMFVVFTLTWVYGSLSLTGEWVWVLYISSILMAGILGELVAKYFSNPLNRMLRSRLA